MTLPLEALHRSRGARFETVEGLDRLVDFGDPESEYRAMDRGCALFDLSDRGRLEAFGEDRVRFLNSQVSNDVGSLEAGRGVAAAVLSRQSKVQALLWVFNLGDRLLLDVEPGHRQALVERLEKYRIADRVTFSPLPEDVCLLSLQGPEASVSAARVLGPAGAGLPPGACAEGSWEGTPIRLFSVSRAGRPGLDLAAGAGTAGALWEALVDAGARPAGWRALEAGRIEAGLPRYGADVTADHLLGEAEAPQAVSYTKGCYIGQEVVARVKSRGHLNRRRSAILAEAPVAAGDKVVAGEHLLGAVGSAAWSFRLNCWVATGVLREPAASQPGAACTIVGQGSSVPARIAALPLLSHKDCCAHETASGL